MDTQTKIKKLIQKILVYSGKTKPELFIREYSGIFESKEYFLNHM